MPIVLRFAALALTLTGFTLAGCASSAVPALPADHPGSTTVTPTLLAAVSSLPPAQPPVLPAPLRRDTQPQGMMAAMDHSAMDHGSASAAESMPARSDSVAPSALSPVLDAYLAVHAALAADRLDGIAEQADAFAAAFAALTATPPSDNPHLWHMSTDATNAIREQSVALGTATSIDAARTAFGVLSAPLIGLVQTLGLPDGYDLTFMTCGMARGVPDGGVWMQRRGTTANPFFGQTMATCGSARASEATDDHSH